MDKYLMTEKEAKQKLKENNNKLVDSSLESFVSLQNVNKVYPNGVHAVYDFNLEINKHDFIALVGPSGGGKTTLCSLIPRFFSDCRLGQTAFLNNCFHQFSNVHFNSPLLVYPHYTGISVYVNRFFCFPKKCAPH